MPSVEEARKAHGAAVAQHKAAKELEADLLARARAADPSVTAADLAAARDAAAFLAHPLDTLHDAIVEAEREAKVLEADAFASAEADILRPLEAAVAEALTKVDAAYDELIGARRAHIQEVRAAASTIGTHGYALHSARFRDVARRDVIDDIQLAPIPVAAQLDLIAQRAHAALLSQ
jgi:hypothetical protein